MSGNGGSGSGGARGGGMNGLDLLPSAIANQQPLVLTGANGNSIEVSPTTLDVVLFLAVLGLLFLVYNKKV